MSRFIVYCSGGNSSAVDCAVFRNAGDGSIENACVVHPRGETAGKIANMLYRVNTGVRHNRNGRNMPLRHHWDIRVKDLKSLISKDETNYLIYCPSTDIFGMYTQQSVLDVRNAFPNCKQVYYFADGVDRTAMMNDCSISRITEYVKMFDAVFTYDRADAKAFGYTFAELPIRRAENVSAGEPSDVYFCGRDKGRAQLLRSIFDRVHNAGMKCRCRVVSTQLSDPAYGIEYTNWVPYDEILRDIASTRCVLELMAPKNHGSTLRCKEAVLYNKKLITNNQQVREMAFYDPKYIQIIESAEDIDLEWLRDDTPVDYGYNGCYDVRSFFEKVEGIVR